MCRWRIDRAYQSAARRHGINCQPGSMFDVLTQPSRMETARILTTD
jgi:hypothetical protein